MLWKILGMKNFFVEVILSYREIIVCRGLCFCNIYEGRYVVDGGLNIRERYFMY